MSSTGISRTVAYTPPSVGARPLLPISIQGEDTAELLIGQRPFMIGVGTAANARRQSYFSGGGTTLLQGEKDLLDYYKIDVDIVAPMLPEFFKALPNCQSDTKVFLKRGCEPVYQVLWMMKMSRTAKGAAELQANAAALAPFGGVVNAMDLSHITNLVSSFDRDLAIARLQRLVQTF
jgi:hypothetical protein